MSRARRLLQNCDRMAKYLILLVEAAGFEPAAPCSQNKGKPNLIKGHSHSWRHEENPRKKRRLLSRIDQKRKELEAI